MFGTGVWKHCGSKRKRNRRQINVLARRQVRKANCNPPADRRLLAKGRERVYFEELDYRPTPIGVLSLRRRRELSLESTL
jgi:hypothetical protein